MMKRKRTAQIIALVATIPLLMFAAWEKNTTTSNGVTPVEIVAAPGASTTRTITAKGGIRVFNGWTNTVSFTLADVAGAVTSVIESVELLVDETYISDWVHILDSTTNSLELTCAEACSNALPVFTHYRDEVQ